MPQPPHSKAEYSTYFASQLSPIPPAGNQQNMAGRVALKGCFYLRCTQQGGGFLHRNNNSQM